MAQARHTYQPLAQDETLIESSAGDTERLLGPPQTSAPRRTELKFSFHPTIYLRLFVCILFLVATIVFFITNFILCGLVLLFPMTRNIFAIADSMIRPFIKIRIEVIHVDIERSPSSKKDPPSKKPERCANVVIDLAIIALILLVVCITWGVNGWWAKERAIAAFILTWIATYVSLVTGILVPYLTDISRPIYLLCAVDTGKPRSISFSGVISADSCKKDKDDSGPLQQHREGDDV
jgi:hypothetical protein